MMIHFSACSQVTSSLDKQPWELRFDTAKTAILKLEKPRTWLFDTSYRQANVTQNDLSLIDSFLITSVNNFNNWQEKNNADNPWIIDLTKNNYKKQIIAVRNKKGKKEVWVNCFRDSFGTSWKSKILVVDEGATCC